MNPVISIIIPARNEEKYITRCLAGIRKLNYPQDKIEIILVDNNSTDNTVKIAENFQPIKILQIEGKISRLRNEGGRMASAKILAFLDADCIPEKDWLKKSINILKDDNNIKVVSAILSLENRDTSPWIEKYWIDYLRAGYVNKINFVETISSFCFVVDKDTMEKIGWFNEKLSTCEDSDLGYRISQSGFNLCVSRNIETVHLGNAKTVKQFYLRQVWQGGSNLKNFFSHKFLLSELPSILIPAFFLFFFLLSVILLLLGYAKLGVMVSIFTVFLPVLISWKKNRKLHVQAFFLYSAIWSIYLFGRGIGLFFSIRHWRN
jgi:cellulose synthase/poly-beta-1,6-N-acetylglucosamine synthase-like glycosyltransferase